MRWTQVEVRWSELKTKARSTWGRLTHDDLDGIRGRRDLLVEKLTEVYGLAKEAAKRQVAEFARNAGAASGRVAVRARSSLKRAARAAKGAGRNAVEKTLDQANAGLDKIRKALTPADRKTKAPSSAPLSRGPQISTGTTRQRKPRRS